MNENTPNIDFNKMKSEAKIDLKADIPPPPKVITVEDRIWGTLDGFSVVMGKAKSKKTFLITAVIAAVTGKKLTLRSIAGETTKDKYKILWFDTEQGRYGVQKAARRALRIAGVNTNTDILEVYALRKYTTKERLEFIDHVINNSPYVVLVVIDGARDLLFDINSPEEAVKTVEYFMKWTEENQIHVLTILHANKTDSNLRGHVGTEFLNKAETVVNVEKDKKDKNISVVSVERGRYREFEPFAFTIDEAMNLPVECDMPVKAEDRTKVSPKQLADEAHKEMIEAIWSEDPEPKTTNDLIPEVQWQLEDRDWKLGRNKALEFIKYWERNKWIKNKRKGRANQYSIV